MPLAMTRKANETNMDNYSDPDKLTEAMKSGLARMYADEDIRAYLMHMVNVYNHNTLACLRRNEMDKAKDFTSKFDTMKRLLENCKAMFTQAEKLRSVSLSEQVKNHEEAKQNNSKESE
jgi:hypothetical protein